MTTSATPTTSWLLTGTRAVRRCPGGEVSLDLADPASGLVTSAAPGDRLLALGLTAADGPTEHWLRGDDLFAVYEPCDARRLRATAYWRPLPGADVPAWELVVSAQTALVESDSALAVTCEVAAHEVLWGGGPGARVWTRAPDPRAASVLVRRRPGAAATSVLVTVHPADPRTMMVHLEGDRARIDCWLFSSLIEKGVLLRSRVVAAVGPTEDDVGWAAAIVGRFAATPAPLTA